MTSTMEEPGYDHAGTQELATLQEDGEKLMLELLQNQGVMQALEGAVLTAIVLGIMCCCWRRPRITATIIFLWLAWFVSHILRQAQGAGFDVCMHDVYLKERKVVWYTSNLLIALFLFTLEWVNLLIPFLDDIAEGSKLVWVKTPEEYRPFIILGLVATLGFLLALRQALKHKDTVKKGVMIGGYELLCQLSFVIAAPLVYMLLTIVPEEVGEVLLFCVITIVPAAHSLHILRTYRSFQDLIQKEEDDKPLMSKVGSILRGTHNAVIDSFAYQKNLDRLFRIVSFWACWPFIRLFDFLLDDGIVVKDTQKPAAYGVLSAVVLWLLFWHGSYIVPWIFSAFSTCFTCCQIAGHRLVNLVREEAGEPLQIVQWFRDFMDEHRAKIVLAAIVLTLLLFFTSIYILQIWIVNQVLSFVFLFGVALDSSARAFNQEDAVCARRCGFWIVVVLWKCLTAIPEIGYFLKKLNVVVYVAALCAGETIITLLISCTSMACGSCLDRLQRHEDEIEERQERSRESARRADAENDSENGGLEMSSLTVSAGDAPKESEEVKEGMIVFRGDAEKTSQEELRRSAPSASEPESAKQDRRPATSTSKPPNS